MSVFNGETKCLSVLCPGGGQDAWPEADSSCSGQPVHLWQFLRELLLKPHNYSRCIRWLNKDKGERPYWYSAWTFYELHLDRWAEIWMLDELKLVQELSGFISNLALKSHKKCFIFCVTCHHLYYFTRKQYHSDVIMDMWCHFYFCSLGHHQESSKLKTLLRWLVYGVRGRTGQQWTMTSSVAPSGSTTRRASYASRTCPKDWSISLSTQSERSPGSRALSCVGEEEDICPSDITPDPQSESIPKRLTVL